MTAALAHQPRPVLRIQFRDAVREDLPYVLDSWRQGWRLSEKAKRLRDGQYGRYFRYLVSDGLMQLDDTKILIGCSESDPSWIWTWLCYTPGPVPTVHFAVVRPFIDDGRGGRMTLRRLGLLTRMLAAAGVRDELVYTFRPAERANRTARESLNLESGLLAAARRERVTAVHKPVEQFLRPRRQ